MLACYHGLNHYILLYLLVLAVHQHIFRKPLKVHNNVPWKLNVVRVNVQEYAYRVVPFQGNTIELQPHLMLLFSVTLLYVSYEVFSYLIEKVGE